MRAHSSVGLEHSPDKTEVPSSILGAPTKIGYGPVAQLARAHHLQ